MFDRVNTLARASQTLVQEWGREPTPAELGGALGLSVAQVLEARQIAHRAVSLETPIGEDGDHPLRDTLTDHEVHSPSDAAAALETRQRIEAVLQTLTPREGEILRRRFGLAEGGRADA